MSADLGSWTRSLNEEDLIKLLDAAQAGEALSCWEERGDELLPQPSRKRRWELIKGVRARLLDLRGEEIQDSRFLRLFQEGASDRRHSLLYGRLLYEHPWILRSLKALLQPRLERSEAPLAPRDAALIPPEAWLAFVQENIKPDSGPSSIKKTPSSIRKHLIKLGVLEEQVQTGEGFQVRRGEPEPLAFGWLLAFEMQKRGLKEAQLFWMLRSSQAARLFLIHPAYGERCLEAAIGAGLLRRGYLAGHARFHPGDL